MPSSIPASHMSREVGQQRQRDPGDVEWAVEVIAIALEREEDHDREEQAVERPRADLRQEALLVPLAAPDAFAEESSSKTPRRAGRRGRPAR
jgi:hypothetical protein